LKRVLLYNLSPSQGEVLNYVTYCLRSMRPHFDRIFVAVNGPLNEASKIVLEGCCDDALLNGDWKNHEDAYKAGIVHLGWNYLRDLDELTLMDCDLFGPVFPYAEMLSSMNAREDLDFWGLVEDAIAVGEDVSSYLPTSFITFRKTILQSQDFQNFWINNRPTNDLPIKQIPYEIQISSYFRSRGYKSDAYISLTDCQTAHPMYLEITESLKRSRRPFIPFSPFSDSPALQDENPANLNRVLPFLERHTEYPTALFWQGALRTATLRTLHTNLGYQFTFNSLAYDAAPKWDSSLKIAVCAHIYYTESFEEIFERASNIPIDFDFYVTTASNEKKIVLDKKFADLGVKADVRVVGENRGRDMSSLFIDLKDVVLEKNYDLICRLHSKKSPQVNPATGIYFKNLVFDSVLGSREYTSHLLDFFVTHPHVGMAFAPMIHTGYASMGQAWFNNKEIFSEILSDLNYKVPNEPYSALAAYGTVFWFRPDALRPMFEKDYAYSQYNEEPNHVDGGLAHGQERAMTYIAQARGYMSATVWPDYVAGQSTTLMEYKMDSLYSHFPKKFLAPHRKLISYFSGNEGRWQTPERLRQFEKRNRALIKKFGAVLGIKSKKKPKRLPV
jgi:lipopolysaccharide biosynthesis protein